MTHAIIIQCYYYPFLSFTRSVSIGGLIIPEHKYTQQFKGSKSKFQKNLAPTIHTPVSNPAAIIQRARIDPKSLTSADVLQLQRTIGNRAVGRLLSEIRKPSFTVQQLPIQRQEIPEEEPLQGMFKNKYEEAACPSCSIDVLQKQELEEEKPLQMKRKNNTGMPDNLKAGMESLSGIDMSNVRVHYNSSKPAEIGALAYTQGTNIHVAPGQERHLPHEAWHVVQQKQGRVKPTMQMKGVAVNDAIGMEAEADVMGARELQESTAYELTHMVKQNGRAVHRYVDTGFQDNIIQKKNGAIPQHFAVTETEADNINCVIKTTKAWQSSTGRLDDLNDIEMREVVNFHQNPVTYIPSYPIVVPTIPRMNLVGNILTKVADTMQSGSGTDTHQGAGYSPSFTYMGIPNLTKGAWNLTGDQVYEYRDRTAAGPWTALHIGNFVVTRIMAVNPETHTYELTFSKVGPGCSVSVTTPINMQTSEAMQAYGETHPDQTPLWTSLDHQITTVQKHNYQTVREVNKPIGAENFPIIFQVTQPSAERDPGLIPYERLTPEEYNPMITNIESGIDTIIAKYMDGHNVLPSQIYIIISKAEVLEQAMYCANPAIGGRPILRIFFHVKTFAQVDPNYQDTSMAGRESQGLLLRQKEKNIRWQKAIVIHEMGHMMHAFNDINKFQAATVNYMSAAQAHANIKPEMYKIASVNERITNAINAKNYKRKWNYARTHNPAEVVAEVWTALMHGKNVPKGLAAVYLAYGGMRNATIDKQLRRLFPNNEIPMFAQPEDALNYI